MSKHAYLIMAHNKFDMLENLIRLLDYPLNDIFVHIDAKAKKFDLSEMENICKFSKLTFIERSNVNWGGYSAVQVEINLLKAALKSGKHQYYHLLSGVDLPLKSNEEIHQFFENHQGAEFIGILSEPIVKGNGPFGYYERMSLYHILLPWWRKSKFLKIIEYISISLQYKLGVDRIRNNGVTYYYGSNWFSITEGFAKYVIENEDYIRKIFAKYTRCSDEIFLQTVFMNSPFGDNLFKEKSGNQKNLRFIDWNRGRPYVFRSCDYNELMSSDALFARKFDSSIDADIIKKISLHIETLEQESEQK